MRKYTFKILGEEMKNRIYSYTLFGLMLLFFNTGIAFAANNVTVLKNGLRVLIVEDDRFPLVAVRLYVHAGGSYEDPKQAGISHLLEHMVFRGTEKRPDGALVKEIESVGGSFNAYTATDQTVYYCDLPSSEWRRGVDVVADMAFAAVLDDKVVEEEKLVVYAEMGQRRENPDMRMYEDIMRLIFEGTPYMHGVLGTKETLKDVKAADIQAYLDAFYNPQSMLLVVVGDVKKDEVLEEAEKHFSSLENAGNSVFPSVFELPLFDSPKINIEENAQSKVLINIAFPTPSEFDNESKTLDILAVLLGGLETSLLSKKFEIDEKIVNSIVAYNSTYNRGGFFAINADVDIDKVEIFWKECIDMLAHLSSKDFTEQDLDATKFLYETSFQRRKATISSYATLLGDNEFAFPGEFSLKNYLHTLKQVDLDDLQSAIETWINPSHMVVSVLAPTNAIEDKLLPNFMEIVETEWIEKREKKEVDFSHENQTIDTTLLPAYAKIVEQSDKRIVIEYASGSKIVLLPDTTMPFFMADLTYAGGNALLSQQDQGLSSALADMLITATTEMDLETFSDYLTQRAMAISADATTETFSVTLDAPTQFEKEGFEQLLAVLESSAFNVADWERLYTDIKYTLRERAETPDALLFSEIRPSLYTGNAYAYQAAGNLETLENLTLDKVKKLWDTQKEQAWVLTVAGDFDYNAVLQFANKLPLNANEFPLLAAPQLQDAHKKVFTLPEKNHAYILQIFPTVPYTSEDAPALSLLQELLGGMSGILFREVRDKQSLAYQVAPLSLSTHSVGLLAFYINTALENREKILPAFKDVILGLQTELLSVEELDAAKISIESDYVRTKQSLGSRVSEASENAYLGRPYNYQEEFIEKIKQISPEQIQEVAKKYLVPETSYVIEVTSEGKE